MAWFRRKLKGIRTETKEKKDTPEGLWHKTPSGNIVDNDELIKNNFVSPADNFHLRIGSDEYFKIIFDNDYEILFENLKSTDPLNFKDTKSYKDRIELLLNSNSPYGLPNGGKLKAISSLCDPDALNFFEDMYEDIIKYNI